MNKPLISFFVLILGIGFAFFYVVPAYNLNVERRGDIESLSKILSTSSEIKLLINKTKTQLGSIDQIVLERFEAFLPEMIDPIRLANNMQYIGRRNRIILSDISVDESARVEAVNGASMNSASQGFMNTVSLGAKIDNAEGSYNTNNKEAGSVNLALSNKYATTKVNFSFTATFEAFQLFLNDIETSLGVLDIVSLSFSAVPESATANEDSAQQPPTYRYSMTVATYSLK